MPYAALLYHYGWRKKKANYIIPPTYFKTQGFSITEKVQPVVTKPVTPEVTVEVVTTVTETTTNTPEVIVNKVEESANSKVEAKTTDGFTSTKVSAFSLKSIAIKKELAESQKSAIKDTTHLPSEEFTETEMLEQWFKYAQRLDDRGHKIMESLLCINEPTLDGTTIIHELPNEGSKIDFEREMHELLGYLRGKLHNHDIKIKIVVNEALIAKKAFTPQDKYNRLNEINPSLDLLRKTFDLDI